MTTEEIDKIFTYHAPTEVQKIKYQKLRDTAKEFAYLLEGVCPNSREKSIAFTQLQMCVMMANASIAINT